MVSIFDCDDYRAFLSKRFQEMPHKGYGQISRLARFLGVHTTLVSQILKGQKELTTDQAAAAAKFFTLGELESEYLVLLVQFARAGNPAAKSIYRKQLQRTKSQAKTLSKRVVADAELNEEQRAEFYSDWSYTAIRLSAGIAGMNDVGAIAEFLQLPRNKVKAAVDFLLRSGLCAGTHSKLQMGPSRTHLSNDSPWARVHHSNWRAKALQSMDDPQLHDLQYTSPVTLSRKDAAKFREELVQLIQRLNSIVAPSPSEELHCVNIDWFQVGKAPP